MVKKQTNIAFLGIGLMGKPMAENLLKNGYNVVAFNRTVQKSEPLRQRGAMIAASIKEAIKQSDCIILMLTDAKAVNDTIFQSGVSKEVAGKTVIQMGTISPSESKEFCNKVTKLGGDYFEAPVLGSIPEVKSTQLIVMVGGSEEQFNRWMPLLKCFSPEPILVGNVGAAAAIKLALNQLIASLTTSFSLSLGLIERSGIPFELFMKILRGSALYAPTFDKKLKRMIERNYTNPNFSTQHLLKDIKLFLKEAKNLNLDTKSLEAIRSILETVLEKGYGKEDYSALFEVIVPKED